jgi:hypothetical protein
MYCEKNGGHGLVVKYVLAKDESGVRFSLAAHTTYKTRHKSAGFCYDILRTRESNQGCAKPDEVSMAAWALNE